MQMDFNLIYNIFLKEISNFIISKKKLSKKRLNKVSKKLILYKIFKLN